MAEAEVVYWGESFRLEEKMALATLIDFAITAKGGADADQMDGLIAIKEVLSECIVPDDFPRFWAASKRARADGEELMKVLTETITAMSARPTQQPSDSSDGPEATPRKSGAASYLRVAERLEDQGRPELAYVVMEANRSTA